MCSSIEVAKHNKGQMTLSDLEKAFLAILPDIFGNLAMCFKGNIRESQQSTN